MCKFTILRNSFLIAAILWFCSLSIAAQVPSTMDYQILATNPKTGMVLANKELNVRVELRLNAEDGETIWSTEEKVTSSKSGLCTISLDFSDVDWSLGTYFIKAFVDGEPIGASQIKSVPFALIADGVRGVITKKKLIGTWVAVDESIDHGSKHREEYVFTFNNDGTFSYSRKKSEYEQDYESYTGTWKLNNLGYILFKVDGSSRKVALPTVFDKEDEGLCIIAPNHTDFYYDTITYYKQK